MRRSGTEYVIADGKAFLGLCAGFSIPTFEGTEIVTRDHRIGICGVALVALTFLAYALFGRPPYVFFSLLKFTVAVASSLGAWALYRESKRYLPISLCLALLAGVHLFGKMRRSEWVKFDWGAAAGLVLLVGILLISLRRRPSTVPTAYVRQPPQLR